MKIGDKFTYLTVDDSVVIGVQKEYYGTFVDLFVIDTQSYVYHLVVSGF